MLKFLVGEENFEDLTVLVEQQNTSESPKMKIKGPYISAERRNKNKRVYPLQVCEEAVEVYNKQYILPRRALGELNHPPKLEIDLDRVCHNVISLKRSGDYYIGESEILYGSGFPKGDILYGLVKNNIKIGISSRGAGEVASTGEVSKWYLKCFDIVSDPSGDSCFVEAILESKNYMIDNHGNFVEIAYENLDKNLSKLSKYNNERKSEIISALKQFMKEI